MSEEEKANTTTSTKEEASKPDTKVIEKEVTKEEVSQEDLNELEKAISDANNSLVSKDVQEQVKVAKEEARVEVEKEFATNQKIKDLEAELKAKDDEKVELQKQTVDQLQALKSKVDDMSASRAVAPIQTPFDKPPVDKPDIKAQLDMSSDEMEQLEEGSKLAFFDRKLQKR